MKCPETKDLPNNTCFNNENIYDVKASKDKSIEDRSENMNSTNMQDPLHKQACKKRRFRVWNRGGIIIEDRCKGMERIMTKEFRQNPNSYDENNKNTETCIVVFIKDQCHEMKCPETQALYNNCSNHENIYDVKASKVKSIEDRPDNMNITNIQDQLHKLACKIENRFRSLP